MNPAELLFRFLALVIIISGAYLLHDGWTCHTWLDKANLYQAKRLLRRAIWIGCVLIASTIAIRTFISPNQITNWLATLAIITIVLGSLMTINAGHRIVRQLY